MDPVVDDLERQAVADALVESTAALLEVEARQLVLAAQWADLHPMSSGTVLPGTERSRRYGGDGTPFAGEFAAADLGVLLGRSHDAAATCERPSSTPSSAAANSPANGVPSPPYRFDRSVPGSTVPVDVGCRSAH